MQSNIGYSATALAQELDVSKRTVFRDLRDLAEIGVPTRYDDTINGFIIQPRFCLKISSLTDDEITALLLAAHVAASACGRELSRTVNQSISKLLLLIPSAVREQAATLLRAVVVESPPVSWPSDANQVVPEIIAAIRQRRCVRVTYRVRGESGRTVQSKITPHRLIVSQETWHLVGRSSRHRKVYRFDLRHICHAERTEETYDSPPASPRAVAISDEDRER